MAGLLRLALFVGLLLFLFFGDLPERSRFWQAFFDAGHTALFGVIALLVRGYLFRLAGRRVAAHPARAAQPGRLLFLAFALTVLLGGATELIQVLQRGGDPSVGDFARDALGAAAFLVLSTVWHARGWWQKGAAALPALRRRRLAVAAAIGLAVALLLVAGAQLILTTTAYIQRDRAFPTLYAFDGSRWEQQFIRPGRNRFTPAQPPATPYARLDLAPGRFSGIQLTEPYPDWRGRRRLLLSIVSDLPNALPVSLRVHDAQHNNSYRDRFNTVLTVQPGVNHFEIALADIRRGPKKRELDLRRVRGIILFVSGLSRPIHLYLGPITLQ